MRGEMVFDSILGGLEGIEDRWHELYKAMLCSTGVSLVSGLDVSPYAVS